MLAHLKIIVGGENIETGENIGNTSIYNITITIVTIFIVIIIIRVGVKREMVTQCASAPHLTQDPSASKPQRFFSPPSSEMFL